MAKVYLLQIYGGQYDDTYHYIHSIWGRAEDAEQQKAKVITEMQLLKELPDPFPDLHYSKMTEKQYEIYEKWETKQRRGEYFHSADVSEWELNNVPK